MSKNITLEQTRLLLPVLATELETVFNWDLVELFHEFLIRDNEKGGFFSKNDTTQIIPRHILDCLLFVWKLKREGFVSRETKVADIGSGPGLPGFLFLCLHERPHVTLIDSQKRKLIYLEAEVKSGSLSQVSDKIHFEYARAEEMKDSFDLVTSRAVVPYPFIVEVASNLLKKGGLLCPFLGQLSFDKKIESRVLNYSGFKLKKEIEVVELSFVGKRHIKILQKDSVSKPGYPRSWKDIIKETKQDHG